MISINQLTICYSVIRSALLSAAITILALSSFVHANEFELQKVAELHPPQGADTNWVSLQAHPSDAQRFYLAESTGQIFLVSDGVIQPKSVLDLGLLLKQKNDLILTAMVLHPSFSLLEQPGFGKLYTAHVELKNEQKRIDRIRASGIDTELKYDAVVTEWQLNKTKTRVEPQGQREILRIAVANKDNAISQLAFEPFIRSWDDKFGFLYIALKNEPTLTDHPLYSGTLLRINPRKFGLRNFTTPKDNPYIKDPSINKEIYLLGGQNITGLMWPKNSNGTMLVSHIYNQHAIIAKAQAGDDWRTTPPTDVVWKDINNSNLPTAMIYHGRHLKNTREKGVFLSHSPQGWHLNSFILNNKKGVLALPNPEGLIESSLIHQSDDISLYEKNDSEILLFDESNNVLFSLTSNQIDTVSTEQTSGDVVSQSTRHYLKIAVPLIFLILITFISVKFYFSSMRRSRTFLHKNYVRFAVDHKQQTISLFRRHQNVKDKVIALSDIISSEIYLNDKVINVINETPGHGFSAELEEQVRAIFKQEHVNKMVDNKIRQIDIVLTDKKQRPNRICMYLRKGNNRLTRQGYQESIEGVIDWCWHIAKLVNPNETPKRVIRVKSSDISNQ
ncbi:hypothetical protein AAD001_13735 [Colwelliaceae bacterium 6471]